MRTFSIPVQVTEVRPSVHPDFLTIKIFAISEGLNVNDSIFLFESMQDAISTMYNKPILAYYSDMKDDVEAHNVQEKKDILSGEWYLDYNSNGSERPIGVIPTDASISIQNFEGKNWLVLDGCIIWKEYNYKLCRMLQKTRRKTVSVEINVEDSELDKDGKDIIKKFRLLGVTVLGNNIKPGIPGAHLDLMSFSHSHKFEQYANVLTFAYHNNQKVDLDTVGKDFDKEGGENRLCNKQFVSKDELGKGKALNVDKSKDAMSTEPWGKVDKSALKKACLKASNYKSICKDVFLQLLPGWEEGKEGSLKYPVMQLKGDSLIYNRYGIASAEAYARQHGDREVLKKINAIRKSLGLDKEEESMKELYAKFGYTFLGLSDKYSVLLKDGKVFAAPAEDDGKEPDADDEKAFESTLKPMAIKAEMSEEEDKVIFEIDFNQYLEAEDKKFEDITKTMEEDKKVMEEERKAMADEKENMEVRMKSMEEEKKVMEEDIEKMKCHSMTMEEEKKVAEEKLAKYEGEVKMAEEKKLNEESEKLFEEEKLEEAEKTEMRQMLSDKKFQSFEEVEMKVAHIQLQKKRRGYQVSLDVKKPDAKPSSIFEELKKDVNLK